MVYKYEWNHYKYPVNAQVAGEYLEGLDKKHNGVTAEIILDESRDKKAVLHPCFEWDNKKAAEQYRLQQARNLMSNLVQVEIIEEKSKKATNTCVRAFVSIEPHNNKAVYRPISLAMSNEDTRKVVIANAYKELLMFKGKYEKFIEFKSIIEAIDNLKISQMDHEGTS